MTKKDQKIIADAEREGIPIFVFTAKDKLSAAVLKNYYQLCFSAECTEDHCSGIIARVKELMEWQLNNPSKVKLPD